jgi:hypothetical protein
VRISPDAVLSLIHVKGAHSTSRTRTVAVSAFEIVASQAAKNSRRLDDLDILRETLMIAFTGRAAWTDGKRVPDRAEFLEVLGSLMPSDKKQVVIVQPHVSEPMCKRIRASAGSQGSTRSRELFRLSTLETLLHTTRARQSQSEPTWRSSAAGIKTAAGRLSARHPRRNPDLRAKTVVGSQQFRRS